ncbi:MAG TPA: hypothetical protein VF923_10165 [Gemmatimonadales bacterium]
MSIDRDERDALAVACSLTTPELRARRAAVLTFVRAHLSERRDLPNGIGLRFPADSSVIARVAELMDAERQCCPFLELRLTVTPDRGPVWLELTGPEGTRDFLTDELGL